MPIKNLFTLNLCLLLSLVANAQTEGCTNPEACNYDEAANTCPDGWDCGCTYDCYGCMDVTACNYDSSATLDLPEACISSQSYDSDAGCLELNLTSEVTHVYNQGGGLPPGIAEGNSVTFSMELDLSQWTLVSNDCDSPGYQFGCSSQRYESSIPVPYTITYSGGYSEIGQITSIDFNNSGLDLFADNFDGNWFTNFNANNDQLVFRDGSNNIFEAVFHDGAGMNLCGSFNSNVNSLLQSGSSIDRTHYWAHWGDWGTYHYDYMTSANEALVTLDSCTVLGCTNPEACNYDEAANTCPDGWDCGCTYDCYGCMDVTACNYDSSATLDLPEACISSQSYDSDAGCLELNLTSEVTHVYNQGGGLPPGIAEGNSVTFSMELDLSQWTLVSNDCDSPGYQFGCSSQRYESSIPVPYTITYSGGYSEIGQITSIDFNNSGLDLFADNFDGNWFTNFNANNDQLVFRDGSNNIFEAVFHDGAGMNLCGSFNSNVNSLLQSGSSIDRTHYWAHWGDWGTYHYDYMTSANEALVTLDSTGDAIGVCGGNCVSDYNNNGICDDEDISGCTYENASNYVPVATLDDGSCTFTTGSGCVGDLDGDGVSATSDLLLFLSVFGSTCN